MHNDLIFGVFELVFKMFSIRQVVKFSKISGDKRGRHEHLGRLQRKDVVQIQQK